MGLAMQLVCTDPIIIHGYDWDGGVKPADFLSPLLAEREVFFVLSLSWTLLRPHRMRYLVECFALHLRQFPKHQIIFLASMPEEQELLAHFDIPSILCPHNAFLDERVFRILTPQEKAAYRGKSYRAVMNASLSRFKRIHLARSVADTCLITYKTASYDRRYEKYLCRRMRHMDFLQYKDSVLTEWYSSEKITEIYNQSQCGLILSAEEGACFASCEYLLCGLPVVTTQSIGGRNAFFHPDYVVTVEPNENAVRAGVEAALALPISPQEIRERTLLIMETYRTAYRNLLQYIVDSNSGSQDMTATWNSYFINHMMHRYPSVDDARALLVEGGLSPTAIPLPS